ncbi:MFS family permease [Enterococcus sp. PF1-24]|nr:MFS family permease [Enterococcus sp. PFB1-1]MDH6402612.1 MFS family permease [Enterococcus sp. PF1-24]
MVFESLVAEKEQQRYLKVSANNSVLIEASSSLGVVIAGILSDSFFDGVYWLQIIINFVAIAVAWQFVEPEIATYQKEKYFSLLKSAFQLVIKIKALPQVMLTFAFVEALGATYYFYFQNYFAEIGISGFGISLVILGSSVFQMLGAKLSPKISESFKLTTIYFLFFSVTAVAIAFSAILPVVATISFYALVNVLAAIINPIRSNYINQSIPSGKRATINSIDSFCFSLMMVLFFPLTGFLISIVSYEITFIGIASCLLLGGFFNWWQLRKVL